VEKTQEEFEKKKSAAPGPPAFTTTLDRAVIARVVEQVLSAQGVTRGSGAPMAASAVQPVAAVVASSSAKNSTSPSAIAAEIADRFFGPTAKPEAASVVESSPASSASTTLAPAASPAVSDSRRHPEPPPKAPVEIQMFVSENDVRRAMTRSEKIFIGRKTILTPSARDLGLEHEVFVETESGSIR
jgi:hypothetical protein